MSVLAEIVADTRKRVEQRKRVIPEPLAPSASTIAAPPPSSFRDALAAPGVSVIAEHKRASPSAGPIRADLTLEQVVTAYERGGARALSILTEESRFAGALQDITAARAVTGLPILRKDFIVDPYQVREAKAAGAAAILLIVAALQREELRALQGLATELGLDVLMEVHDRAELEVALGLDPSPPIIGINNRNLATLQVDLGTTYELVREIPAGTIKVSESGLGRREQLEELSAAGVDAVLIGEALMRSADLGAACRELTAGNAE